MIARVSGNDAVRTSRYPAPQSGALRPTMDFSIALRSGTGTLTIAMIYVLI